jgi:YbgC/YbaW family acyl-CoA thioester hydrolase
MKKQLAKIVESKVKVRFPDCDPFNHLNNSKYIDYFLNAREDHLLMYYDFDLQKLAQEKGISWVVAQNQIAYLIPATLMETVTIKTALISYNQKSLILEATMWNEEKTILKAVLWSTFIHVNLTTKRSQLHTEEMMSLFNAIENPLDKPISFEERVKLLKQLRG